MTYEIRKLDGVYVVFKKDRIIAAFNTKKEAFEAVKNYRTSK